MRKGDAVIDKLLMKLRARDEVSPAEEAVLRDAIGKAQQVPADHTIVRAGELVRHSTLLIDGLMCRYKDVRSGARQIAELHIAGDFVDLHSVSLKRLDHNIMALTPCTIATVPHERLVKITEQMPHLTRLLWFSTNLDASIHREWVLSLGRRNALSRVAHLLCEMQVRLALVGLAEENGYRLDITQADLAECLGLTPVHVNRVLRELREGGLADFRKGEVRILDKGRLWRVAEFDPLYLQLEPRPL